MRIVNPRFAGSARTVTVWRQTGSDAFGATSWARGVVSKCFLGSVRKNAIPDASGASRAGSGRVMHIVRGITQLSGVDSVKRGDRISEGLSETGEPPQESWQVNSVTDYDDRTGAWHHSEVELD